MASALLTALIFLAAMLYSSVGHAGASAYLALMALMNVAPDTMKPAALALNILVASIATFRFARAGAFRWHLFWPFALSSVPCAYLGGAFILPVEFYKPLVGLVLLYAAWRALSTAQAIDAFLVKAPPLWLALPIGAALGFLSGLTGVGGGIFLSPLMLLRRWADPRTISGVAAPFILVNSMAGLAGVLGSSGSLPPNLAPWLGAAAIGGFIGSGLGSRRMRRSAIQRALALVLIIAGLKMLMAAWP